VTTGLARRIAAVDVARPDVDPARVDAAFGTHFDRLGLEPRRVWWEDDVSSARRACTVEREAREWWLARSRCRAAAEAAGWRPRPVATNDERQTEADPVGRIAAAWDAVEAATRNGEPRREPFRRVRPLRPDESLPPNPVAPWLVDAVAWSSAPAPFARAASVARWTEACVALVDAYEAGLGFFWVLVDWVFAVPRPALSLVDGVLHDAAGPAVSWLSGERYWFWHGLRVPQRVVEDPGSLTVRDVQRERNVERRRVLLERMGYDRYVREGGGRLIGEDECGRLWWCNPLPDEREPLVLVEVENATREPDGSARRYFLRVPPATSTPREAVAWSFGLAAPEYAPTVES
jgi:hypothetical protein